MKKLLITSAIVAFTGSAAHAQISFQSGLLTFGYISDAAFANADNFSFTAQGDYNIGQMGLQLDGSISAVTDFTYFFAEYSIGAHVYKEFGNGTKVGAFANADYFDLFGSNVLLGVGVEGMKRFGALDIEASVGWLTVSDQPDGFGIATLEAYYSVSPSIEVSAGYFVFFDTGNSFTSYRVGANYTLANLPIAIGVNYYNVEDLGTLQLEASYAFGAPGDERLFGSRAYPLFTSGG